MLRYKTETRPSLVALYDRHPAWKRERVHSYNPGARTGRMAAVRRSRNFRPAADPLPGGAVRPTFNQLDKVTNQYNIESDRQNGKTYGF